MVFCLPFNLFRCAKIEVANIIEPSKIIKHVTVAAHVAEPVSTNVAAPVAAHIAEPVAAHIAEPVSAHVAVPNLIGAAAAASIPTNTLIVVPPQITMDENSTDSSNPCWDKECVALLISVGLLGLMITPILAVMFPVMRGVNSIMDTLVKDDDVKYKVE